MHCTELRFAYCDVLGIIYEGPLDELATTVVLTHCILQTAHYTLHNAQYTVKFAHYTLSTAHFTLNTAQCTQVIEAPYISTLAPASVQGMKDFIKQNPAKLSFKTRSK